MVIQLGQGGVNFDRDRIPELRCEFQKRHYVRLPQLLEQSLMDFLQQRLKAGLWRTRIHEGVGQEYVLDNLPALSLLNFAANSFRFRQLIEEITGCGPLRRFRGRVYRMIAGKGHYDSWHDDYIESRLVGMSLNLSPDVFRGGLFLLRDKQSGKMVAEIPNTGLGDALIFRISPGLKHRVSELEGDKPKTAFAGWFVSNGPELLEELRNRSRTPAANLM
jgi:hypothetical protein